MWACGQLACLCLACWWYRSDSTRHQHSIVWLSKEGGTSTNYQDRLLPFFGASLGNCYSNFVFKPVFAWFLFEKCLFIVTFFFCADKLFLNQYHNVCHFRILSRTSILSLSYLSTHIILENKVLGATQKATCCQDSRDCFNCFLFLLGIAYTLKHWEAWRMCSLLLNSIVCRVDDAVVCTG